LSRALALHRVESRQLTEREELEAGRADERSLAR
jgi:hypothetical protein